MTATAFTGARIFDGTGWHAAGAALVVRDGAVEQVGDAAGGERVELGGGMIVPGFVDLQVNGGGGVLLNDDPGVAAIRRICAAHARFGTTALLPTLITDTPAATRAAIEAGVAAASADVPGFLGLHLEGPHLSIARKGAHDPALIRPMTDADLLVLCDAAARLPVLLVTVAAESVRPDQVAALSKAGAIVSIGHSDAGLAEVQALADAGASMATHLFNAMSQIGNREPGLAGAALSDGRLSAGLIADGIHVHPATMGLALRGKQGPGRIFLVSDAMAVAGTDLTEFSLNGRTIHRAAGALRLADGTLAGADLTMIEAVRFVHRELGIDLGDALRMAALYPALAIGGAGGRGRLTAGSRADFVHLDDDLQIRGTWISGVAARDAA